MNWGIYNDSTGKWIYAWEGCRSSFPYKSQADRFADNIMTYDPRFLNSQLIAKQLPRGD